MKKNRRIESVLFQGSKKQNHYFEGWYYKSVSSDRQTIIALIPGVSLYKEDTHAFIQVFITSLNPTVSLQTYYLRYSIDDFSYEDQPFSVTIKNNLFSLDTVRLNIETEELSLQGQLLLSQLTPIKHTLYAPNIMGPFSYIPKMECAHGVVSMNHHVKGSIMYNKKEILFDDGKGYIEKDWGTSFPKEYIWLQSNHFTDVETSFMFSYATIPFLKMSFNGLICVLYHKGIEYRFSTYYLVKVKQELLGEHKAYYKIKQGKHTLEITARTDHVVPLVSPEKGQMINQIKEGISGTIDIKLYQGNTLIMDDKGYHAGIEIMKK